MNVDLSRSIDQSFRKALLKADRLHETGKCAEAAAVYREAAVLVRQLAKFAVSPAEKARRLKRGDELESYAEKILQGNAVPSPPAQSQHSTDDTDLQDQINALITRANVAWDDIGGLETTKREIQLAFGMAVAQKPEGVQIDVVNNALLYGPPGTGKSLLAAAISNGLRATFFNVAASSLLSKWFGESSRLISALYATARRQSPAVVFIDELECLFPSRDSVHSGAEHQVLSSLLAELSGVGTSGNAATVFTIGATNTPWLMDSAALSRFGRRIYVPLPDAQARQSVLEIHWMKRGHSLEFTLDRLVEAAAGLSGRQLAHIAATTVERMVADCNPELAEVVAQGKSAENYHLQTRPLRWDDVEPALARTKPETSPDVLRRFEQW